MLISRRGTILGMVASGFGLALPAWAGSNIADGEAFGGFWRLVTEDTHTAMRAKSVIDEIVDEVTHKMSPYRADSELSRFNASQSSDWQELSEASCFVAAEALRIAAVSGGAFDPTVGPLVARFGFGPIQGAMGQYDDLVVAPHAIRKRVPGLTLDLCGIAKGYAVDRVSEGLVQAGIEDAMIEIGGEVRALGQHPSGRAWKIGIADPLSDGAVLQRIVKPGKLALATSGHAVNGVRKPANISHIVNPQTERPARMSLASVSVLAPTCMEADALATALCAQGAIAGIALAKRLDVTALFVTDGSEAPVEVFTGGFEAHIDS